MATIDAHVHFYQYKKNRQAPFVHDNKMLQQDYLPEGIELNLKRNGMDGCIAVESEGTEVETRFLCELAKTHPVIKGVVGWIDLSAPDIEKKLEDFAVYPEIKGYRYTLTGPNTDLSRGVAALATHGYSLDLLVHAGTVPYLISQYPGQTWIIDHCASPDIKHKAMDEWKSLIRDISSAPGVFCKLSGLLTLAAWKSWTPSEFYPYFDVVFEYFGPDRLLFGSDWPYMLVSGIYVQWKSMIEKYMASFSEDDREKVFGSNAMAVYKLGDLTKKLDG